MTDRTVITDLTNDDFAIQRPSDVLELVGRGIDRFVLLENQLADDFFDLSTGFAGELVQKCNNYGIKVAVVETSAKPRSTSFRQFASESNRGNRFIFVANIDEGMRRLNA